MEVDTTQVWTIIAAVAGITGAYTTLLLVVINAKFAVMDAKFARSDERQDRIAAEVKEIIVNKLLKHTEAKH